MAHDVTTASNSTFSLPEAQGPVRAKAVRKPLLTEPKITAILFLIPALAIFLVFVVWPIIQAANFSFLTWDGVQPPTSAGWANYQRLFADPIFWRAISNNVIVVIWSLVTQIPLAIGLAILLTGSLKGSAFFR